MSTIFSKIINREIPAYIIHEDEFHIAFLDINPLTIGHTLVVPKQEVDYFFDLPTERLHSLMTFSKEVAFMLKHAIPCKRIGMSVIGLEVPHAHIHLIPINNMSEMNFMNKKLSLTEAEAEILVKKTKKIQ